MSYEFDFGVVLSGEYLDWLIRGTIVTVQLAGVSLVLALALGVAVAVCRLAPFRPLNWLAASYVEFVRNTPLLVQMLFWYFGATEVLPDRFTQWLYEGNFEFVAAAIALIMYTAAFISEDVRSGIRSIPREQMEAARASGLRFLQAMRYVVLPQALRITVPPLINQALNVTKNSSLAMAIGVAELTYRTREIEAYTFKAFEAFAACTTIYLALSLIITGAAWWYERSVLQRRPA
ncbi:MAG: amino acid ABC transporter permease [Burkholderiales bacterium]